MAMFEDTLSLRRERGSPRRLSLPVAVALHGIVLAGVVGASLWFEDEPPEPSLPVMFYKTVSAAPPGGGADSSRPHAPREKSRMRAAPTRLTEIPAPSPVAAPEEELLSVVESTVEIDGKPGPGPGVGNRPDGPPGGTGDGPIRDRDEIFQPGGNVRSPELVRKVEPDYPEAARRARIEGVVILEAVINAQGGVEDVRVVHSAGPLLDFAAAEAVARWTYRPATLNGRAVRVLLTVNVTFRVH
jgi:protein TonB